MRLRKRLKFALARDCFLTCTGYLPVERNSVAMSNPRDCNCSLFALTSFRTFTFPLAATHAGRVVFAVSSVVVALVVLFATVVVVAVLAIVVFAPVVSVELEEPVVPAQPAMSIRKTTAMETSRITYHVFPSNYKCFL